MRPRTPAQRRGGDVGEGGADGGCGGRHGCQIRSGRGDPNVDKLELEPAHRSHFQRRVESGEGLRAAG